MELNVTGDVILWIQNLRDGNEVTSTMQSGEFVVDDVVIPFILQRTVYGKIAQIGTGQPIHITLRCFEKSRSTPFARQGYVSILVTTKPVQMYVYIKEDRLKNFFATFCMAAI